MDEQERHAAEEEIRALRLTASYARGRSARPGRNERERQHSRALARAFDAKADEMQAELDAFPLT